MSLVQHRAEPSRLAQLKEAPMSDGPLSQVLWTAGPPGAHPQAVQTAPAAVMRMNIIHQH